MAVSRTIVAACLALAACAAHAQIYRWVDENGRLHAGDTPPPGARHVEKRAGATAATEPAEPYALQLARKNAPITLYSTPNCPLCDRARQLLNARGVPFKEISVVTAKQAEELVAVVGKNAVPSLLVGPKVQEGFEETTYHGLLDGAGYPKTGELPPRAQHAPGATPAAVEALGQDAPSAPTGPYAPGARRPRP